MKNLICVLLLLIGPSVVVAGQQSTFVRQPLTTNAYFGPLPSEGHVPIWNASAKKWSNGIPGSISSSIINIRNAPYNAKADGSDDTRAFQQALSKDGAIVYFPSGSYSVSTLVISNTQMTLLGDGVSSRLLARVPGPIIRVVDGLAHRFMDFQLMGNRVATHGILFANSGSQSVFRNVEVIYATTPPGIGIATETVSYSLLFDRCSIQNNQIGMRLLPGAQGARISNSLIYNNTNYQVILGNSTNMLSSVSISGSSMEHVGKSGTNLLVENVSPLTLNACSFEPIGVAGKDIVILGNSLVGIDGMYSNGNLQSTNSIYVNAGSMVELCNSYIYNFLSSPIVGPLTIRNSKLNTP